MSQNEELSLSISLTHDGDTWYVLVSDWEHKRDMYQGYNTRDDAIEGLLNRLKKRIESEDPQSMGVAMKHWTTVDPHVSESVPEVPRSSTRRFIDWLFLR